MSRKFPLFHAMGDDVELFVKVEGYEVDVILAHQFARGCSGRIAVLNETPWIGLTIISSKRKTDLGGFRSATSYIRGF